MATNCPPGSEFDSRAPYWEEREEREELPTYSSHSERVRGLKRELENIEKLKAFTINLPHYGRK